MFTTALTPAPVIRLASAGVKCMMAQVSAAACIRLRRVEDFTDPMEPGGPVLRVLRWPFLAEAALWQLLLLPSRSARRLVKLAERNRGVYVKLGQHASAMEYLLPVEYTQQLQQLQRNMPPSSMAQVEEVLKQELKLDRLDAVFQEFEEAPVGAASFPAKMPPFVLPLPRLAIPSSLAQVHYAVLTNGEPVAVKVQHADVRALAEADTRVVEILTKVASRIFPEVRFEWLVELLRENLPAELDFRKEAANARRCRLLLQEGSSTFEFSLPRASVVRSVLTQLAAWAVSRLWLLDPQKDASKEKTGKVPPKGKGSTRAVLFSSPDAESHATASLQSHQRPLSPTAETQHPEGATPQAPVSHYEVELYVPRVYNNLTTSRVLVMERCEGVPVDDLRGLVAQGIHPLAVSAALSELYGRLIFDLGFVHADPHPGNVIVHLEGCPLQNKDAEQQRRSLRLLLPSLTRGGASAFSQNINSRPAETRKRLRLSLLDHGLYCSLTHPFRRTYARLWLAMQRGDIGAVTACANEFGVSKLAGLLAVILSLRSEEREAELLRRSFSAYFSRITNVLQEVPHELILLIKTNDLLRAIQVRLGIDEALVLVPLLHRATNFVGTSELQELERLHVPILQVLLARWRLWSTTVRWRWAQQLLEVRSMNWASSADIAAIDRLCGLF
ncbi:hypothetical protein cyc_04319 [Cyclospora cayetanensis]|uniref:ABC1 atypical kinase-like domain-containing protein n=1 Tax=Cyclospora cayetanensis TaxID=88456 RepID=A0A1D3D750_9EIME|nr:hypothetical protein cyc_04319 [Cyclospora cayetanensis]